MEGENGPIAIYGIPWDADRCGLKDEVWDAGAVVKQHLKKGIKWLRANYVPPVLAVEVARSSAQDKTRRRNAPRSKRMPTTRPVGLLVGEKDDEL
ncbi:MAG: hypothetical protein QW700_07950 [Desulfurococcaceae archaeon]|uniref:hypothetical protein n=1 Tax=Pyrobaculum sp. TaxID=2004705 RepID=UPI0031687D5F